MQRLALLALAATVQAVAGRTCSCECCETSLAREEEAVQCSLAQGTPSAPRCDGLCAKSADDDLLETTQSFLDTERFCFVECVPVKEDSPSGSPCQPLSSGPSGRRPRPRRLRLPRAVPAAPVALAREAPEAPSEAQKLLEETKKQAKKAQEAAEEVQRASYGGAGTVAEAARLEDDARRAAGFATGVEAQLRQLLAEARRQAKDEASATMQEVLPYVQQQARAAAKQQATLGPFSKLEKSQKEEVEATAAAAAEGLKPWADAMQNAAKVRDAYSQRSHELAQAAVAAQETAQGLNMAAQQWRQLKGDPSKAQVVARKAERLQEQAKEAMEEAGEQDAKARKYLNIAKSIDDSLPAYSRQSEQGAYHAMAMVSPDVPVPLPPLVFVQQK